MTEDGGISSSDKGEEGYIHSVVTGGTVDGPGIRFVIFTSGCPLRCVFCHNPDTRHVEDGKLTKASELVEEVSHYKDFMDLTSGGVTVSGGEPLFQQDFVTKIFEGCKALGIHTALDTCGYRGKNVSQDLLNATDLVLLDIKSFDPDTYKNITGSNLRMTLDFAEHLARLEKPMWVRCVVVPDLNDDLSVYQRLADYLRPLGNVEKVELLPFHKMGEPKWKSLGLDYSLTETKPPLMGEMKEIAEIFKSRGLCVA